MLTVKLERMGKNKHVVRYSVNGKPVFVVCYSYQEPVVLDSPEGLFARPNQWGVTTARHINDFLELLSGDRFGAQSAYAKGIFPSREITDEVFFDSLENGLHKLLTEIDDIKSAYREQDLAIYSLLHKHHKEAPEDFKIGSDEGWTRLQKIIRDFMQEFAIKRFGQEIPYGSKISECDFTKLAFVWLVDNLRYVRKNLIG